MTNKTAMTPETFHAHCTAIAEAIGWAIETPDVDWNTTYYRVARAPEILRQEPLDAPPRMAFQLDVRRGKITMNGLDALSNEDRFNVTCDEITIGADRDLAAAARDVQRRILPQLLSGYSKAAEDANKESAAKRAQGAVRERLVAALGSCAIGRSRGLYEISCSSARFYGDFSLSHDGSSVTIEMRALTPAQAERVALLLGELAREEGEI